MTKNIVHASNDNCEFLAFTLGDKEIHDYETSAKIANMAGFFKGIINLRGA